MGNQESGGTTKKKSEVAAKPAAKPTQNKPAQNKPGEQNSTASVGKDHKDVSRVSSSGKEAPRVHEYMLMDDENSRKRLSKKLEKQQVPQRSATTRKVGLF